MKTYWFTLYGDTFLWLKERNGLVYNSINKAKFIFELSPNIEKICHHLLVVDNLYTVELTEDEIDGEIGVWIRSIINIRAGYLSENIAFEERPVSLMPVLKVQDDRKYYEEQHLLGYKGRILQNLHELIFYINGSEYGSDAYFRQTIFPVRSGNVLGSDEIEQFVRNSRNPYLSNINFVGNLFSYPNFEDLINNIIVLCPQIVIHILISDFLNHVKEFGSIEWNENVRFNILVNSAFEISSIENITLPFSITAFVFSEADFVSYSNIFETLGHQVKYLPLYNGKNLSFFESYIYMQKNDIEEIKLSKDEIFMRQAINVGSFGKLTVMLDGKIYANVNEQPLGCIGDTPYSIVYNEFKNGASWFRLRDQKPCSGCIYQWLCPSPSDYEIVIGRSNLCHIK